jgi:hypothetical protein
MADNHIRYIRYIRGIFDIGSDTAACGTSRRPSRCGNCVVLSAINVRLKAVVG